jgi:leucyl-tRNA synthetase
MGFSELDAKWQARWEAEGAHEVEDLPARPKYYILDMFPYPSGAGLHVGHPLGYIATDIIARYKRHRGYAVLHPMGFDAFGLPAENYALRTGIHPAITTERNISRYTEQLKRMGLGYPWKRAVRTCDTSYYKWTQYIFLLLFSHWYDKKAQKARPISELEAIFTQSGNAAVEAATSYGDIFSAAEWHGWDEKRRSEVLMQYRLAYTAEGMVNWCPALGTVLANEEVKDGYSERGGHPVYRVPMRQWFLRITAYAERLLEGLEQIEWPEAIKEQQRHWIGRSEGAIIYFSAQTSGGQAQRIEVFSTRPDTLWGATFLVLAPEHPLVDVLVAPSEKATVAAYQAAAQRRSERERLVGGGTPTGVFVGAWATHPYTGERLPIWISDYVLMGYGTGAIMAVPAHDQRDWLFAKHFGLPIRSILAGVSAEDAAYEAKDGTLVGSDFLTGLSVSEAIAHIRSALQRDGKGLPIVQYRLRDVVFSRQRYWGEPFPIVWKDDIPHPLPVEELPVQLPPVERYEPTGDGRSPLARIQDWVAHRDGQRETDTMPGWAGSSWYFLRYCDPHNCEAFASLEKLRYWLPVDLYVGGAEHAVGHLLYARFWTYFLYDLGLSPVQEPFHRLVNQGMILGRSLVIYKHKDSATFVSADRLSLQEKQHYISIRIDIRLANDTQVDVEAFRKWMPEYAQAEFVLSEDGAFYAEPVVEKMSKSFHNVVTPDELCEVYGADTFRLYEMFLGPLTQTKPWDPRGIQGPYQFLRRLWRFLTQQDDVKPWIPVDLPTEAPNREELRVLHVLIKRLTEDIERLSLNTCVSHFMTFLNEMHRLGCRKRAIWEPVLVLLEPFAPHIASELWERLGHTEVSLQGVAWPTHDPALLEMEEITYPVSVNGKLRFHLPLAASLSPQEIESHVRTDDRLMRYTQGKVIQKVIVVPGRIINVVV